MLSPVEEAWSLAIGVNDDCVNTVNKLLPQESFVITLLVPTVSSLKIKGLCTK